MMKRRGFIKSGAITIGLVGSPSLLLATSEGHDQKPSRISGVSGRNPFLQISSPRAVEPVSTEAPQVYQPYYIPDAAGGTDQSEDSATAGLLLSGTRW